VDAAHLTGVPLLADLSKRDLEHVARWADEVDMAPGRHLLDEGALPHEFFLILEGEVEVTHDGQTLANLGPGDFFGEIAILEDMRRTATVVTTTPCRLAVMTPQAFSSMRSSMPVVADRIEAAAMARMGR
jgi:CRP/FNR family transcriptional regulator, cyclic AMP receptor protein